MIVGLAHAAEAELEAAMAWYDAQREGLGLLLFLAVSATVTQISEAPRSFTPVGPGGRYC